MKKTPLFQLHKDAGAHMVDFAGWLMPVHYHSQLEEHKQVRSAAGMFDVSHMHIVDVTGSAAKAYLQYLLANDVDKCKQPGKALYSCMLNADGGVVDDLIVYCISETQYRLVLNAGTRDKDTAWLQQQTAGFDVQLCFPDNLAIIAVQGPSAIEIFTQTFPQFASAVVTLKPFTFCQQDAILIARTGYTGEDGLEIILPATDAQGWWSQLQTKGVAPIGLGARDTLRLEAGLNLYGQDMDEDVTPLGSNLSWTVSFCSEDRKFIGREALLKQQNVGLEQQLLGLLFKGRGVLRHGQSIVDAEGKVVGQITSGGYSPTLGHSIAFARLPTHLSSKYFVKMRGKTNPVEIVKLPFVRKGQCVYKTFSTVEKGT